MFGKYFSSSSVRRVYVCEAAAELATQRDGLRDFSAHLEYKDH
jgi:hypothetical protein